MNTSAYKTFESESDIDFGTLLSLTDWSETSLQTRVCALVTDFSLKFSLFYKQNFLLFSVILILQLLFVLLARASYQYASYHPASSK